VIIIALMKMLKLELVPKLYDGTKPIDIEPLLI
jgi:hypothetical protein